MLTPHANKRGWAKACCIACLLSHPVHAAQDTNPATNPVTEAREMVETWVSLEQQRTALEQSWDQQRQQLSLRLQLLANERDQLRRTVETRSEATDEVEQERLDLLEQQTRLESDQEQMTVVNERLLVALRVMLPQLPPPLANSWREALNSGTVQLEDNSQILQLALDLLGRFNDFQSRMTLHEDTITGGDGEQRRVRQLYMGVSQAWYVSADGEKSGMGHPTPAGWQWEPDAGVEASSVQRAIRMIENNQDIGLMGLPIQVRSSAVAASGSVTDAVPYTASAGNATGAEQ